MEKKKVLVIEDINQMFLLYKYCLESYFEVVQAKTLSDLKNFENKTDVVATILDYHIPGENFEHVLEYVIENYINSKRVMISGHADTLELKQKYGRNLDEVFSKPLDDYTKLAEYLIELVGLDNLKGDQTETTDEQKNETSNEQTAAKEQKEEDKEITEEEIRNDLLNRELSMDEISAIIKK
ncbi:DNA-binding transcriptional response regulator [Salinibacillus xinjiangensis]|uniref:Response regulator n=1 Tax=Salinibacillus xinjiangensis TaxID=1229268 RepID=A0A6G1X2Y1_9BACI|nr:response regulator [Salinibacillus xinjiangensis]MRG85256.1 hypothetical protein [Salinibacillus xinjiangensis]